MMRPSYCPFNLHFAFTRFMTPWIELAWKLLEFDFIARRYTPTTSLSLPAYTRSHAICRTPSATKSLWVRLASTMASVRFCGTSL